MLYTSQFRYSGPERLDITVKSAGEDGKWFAPTWMMVRTYKDAIMRTKDAPNHVELERQAEAAYEKDYYNLLIARFSRNRAPFIALRDRGIHSNAVLVCYCPPRMFCHRLLLCRFMAHNFEVPIGPELAWNTTTTL